MTATPGGVADGSSTWDREGLLDRVRALLSGRDELDEVEERPMVGGARGVMVGGHLCCAVNAVGLTVRVGPDARDDALAVDGVEPLEVGSRRPRAFVVVAPALVASDEDLAAWVDRGLAFVATLP